MKNNHPFQAAIDLYGLCSPEMKSVVNAWYAVAVGGQAAVGRVQTTSDFNVVTDITVH